jgi:hypothetical protein
MLEQAGQPPELPVPSGMPAAGKNCQAQHSKAGFRVWRRLPLAIVLGPLVGPVFDRRSDRP